MIQSGSSGSLPSWVATTSPNGKKQARNCPGSAKGRELTCKEHSKRKRGGEGGYGAENRPRAPRNRPPRANGSERKEHWRRWSGAARKRRDRLSSASGRKPGRVGSRTRSPRRSVVGTGEREAGLQTFAVP